jgi:nicotinamidase-related amidase
MSRKALVVIDIQNDITRHYREIIDRINDAIDWAVENGLEVVYIKHNNLSAGTRTFKPDYREIEAMTALSGDRPGYIGWVPIESVLYGNEISIQEIGQ